LHIVEGHPRFKKILKQKNAAKNVTLKKEKKNKGEGYYSGRKGGLNHDRGTRME